MSEYSRVSILSNRQEIVRTFPATELSFSNLVVNYSIGINKDHLDKDLGARNGS